MIIPCLQILQLDNTLKKIDVTQNDLQFNFEKTNNWLNNITFLKNVLNVSMIVQKIQKLVPLLNS